MKAIILTSIFTVLSFTAVLAVNPKQKVLNNTETRSDGTTKEYIFVDNDLRPEKKTTYEYDHDGMLLSKVTHKWNLSSGDWSGISRYDYEYNASGKVANIIYTEWNRKGNDWSSKCQCLLHTYSLDGELLSIRQVEMSNNNELFAGK